jgi:hypothetical protein
MIDGDKGNHETAHGVLMMLGFGFFLIWGMLAARYTKTIGASDTWFKVSLRPLKPTKSFIYSFKLWVWLLLLQQLSWHLI